MQICPVSFAGLYSLPLKAATRVLLPELGGPTTASMFLQDNNILGARQRPVSLCKQPHIQVILEDVVTMYMILCTGHPAVLQVENALKTFQGV